MQWPSGGIAQIGGSGTFSIRTTLVLLLTAWQCSSSLASGVEKGTPEGPSTAAVLAGKYSCRDGNAYWVVLTLNSDGSYWTRGTRGSYSQGDASGTGTWRLSERRLQLLPSKEEGWMQKEPKAFDVLRFKGDWILVRVDRRGAYGKRGVTDASCFRPLPPEDRYTPLEDRELPMLPPLSALVEQTQPCAAYLKTSDGRRLRIGGPGAIPEVAGFVPTLREGQIYAFPKVFLEHRKRQGRAAGADGGQSRGPRDTGERTGAP